MGCVYEPQASSQQHQRLVLIDFAVGTFELAAACLTWLPSCPLCMFSMSYLES